MREIKEKMSCCRNGYGKFILNVKSVANMQEIWGLATGQLAGSVKER